MNNLHINFRKLCQSITRQANKIKIRLFVTYFVIIILLITGLGSFSYYYSSRSVEIKVQNAHTEIIDQINKNLESNFQQIRSIMLVPYYNTDFITGLYQYEQMTDHEKVGFQQKMQDYFLKAFYLTQRKDFRCFYLFSKAGKLLFTSSSENSVKIEDTYKNGQWVKKTVKKKGSIYFGGTYKEIVHGKKETLFSSSIMIKDFTNDQNFSIVRADFDFSIISDICQSQILGNKPVIVLVDEYGNIAYSTGKYKPATLFRSDIIKKMDDDSGSFWTKIAGKRYMINYKKSHTSNWNIISMISADNIFDASVKIKRITIIISIFAFLLTAFISFGFASKITSPIMKLSQTMDKVRNGNLDIRIKSDRKDELGNIYAIFNTLLDEINSLIKTKYLYQLKQRESELNLLHAQINPHFLYNTLDTIRAMADYHKMDDVAQMVNLLADMFRYSVRNINELVTVKQEFNYIRDYLTILRIRFNNRIVFQINVDENIMNYKIPRLILQPIIENAVLHGLQEKKEKGYLKIQAILNNSTLEFCITDNGIGIDQMTLDKLALDLNKSCLEDLKNMNHRSIGLANIQNRLTILYGPNEYIRIKSEKNHGTEVTLTVPILTVPIIEAKNT
jgi:two-component system, sensor histidine kinase YesM